MQIGTNRYVNTNEFDCYDSCGLYLLISLYGFWLPSLIIWGVPFFSMSLYSTIGRPLGFKGHYLKFMILYSTRFLGLMWHIFSQLFGVLMVISGYDYIFPGVHLVTSFLLEQAYTEVGAEAVRYIDPTWTQGDDVIYPFAV